jgi:MOSC domain-containing protein YiiM
MCVEQLFISPGHNYFGHHGQKPDAHPIVAVDEIECVAGRGIRGDRFFDYKPDYKGQITFFAAEVLDALARELGLAEASPAATRRNVITRGVNLNALVGVEFELQGVRFAGVEECRPCYWMNNAFRHEQAESWLKGNGGLRARILSDGILRATVAAGILPAVEPGFQPGGANAASERTSVESERLAAAAALSGRQDAALHGSPGGPPPPSNHALRLDGSNAA